MVIFISFHNSSAEHFHGNTWYHATKLAENIELIKVQSKVILTQIFSVKIVNIFLPIIFNICFGCSKELDT